MTWPTNCTKIQYRTEREAKLALVAAITGKNRGRNHRRECRYYRCPTCHFWHLTSHPKPPPVEEVAP